VSARLLYRQMASVACASANGSDHKDWPSSMFAVIRAVRYDMEKMVPSI